MSIIATCLLAAKGAAVVAKSIGMASGAKAAVLKGGAYVIHHYTTSQIISGAITATVAVGGAKVAYDIVNGLAEGVKEKDPEKVIDAVRGAAGELNI